GLFPFGPQRSPTFDGGADGSGGSGGLGGDGSLVDADVGCAGGAEESTVAVDGGTPVFVPMDSWASGLRSAGGAPQEISAPKSAPKSAKGTRQEIGIGAKVSNVGPASFRLGPMADEKSKSVAMAAEKAR